MASRSFSEFFGPSNRPVELDGSRAALALPAEYAGPNEFLLDKIVSRVLAAPELAALAPEMGEPDGPIVWSEIFFNLSPLDTSEESSTPFPVTHRKNESDPGASTRYDRAFALEHGFLQTPDGRVLYDSEIDRLVGGCVSAISEDAAAVSGETRTYIGHAEFDLRDNLATKKHCGSFSIYFRTVAAE